MQLTRHADFLPVTPAHAGVQVEFLDLATGVWIIPVDMDESQHRTHVPPFVGFVGRTLDFIMHMTCDRWVPFKLKVFSFSKKNRSP